MYVNNTMSYYVLYRYADVIYALLPATHSADAKDVVLRPPGRSDPCQCCTKAHTCYYRPITTTGVAI